jgi:hypothetical protein
MNRTKIVAGLAFFVLLTVASGCSGCRGCAGRTYSVGGHLVQPRAWMAQRCKATGPYANDCPAADADCPQGYDCTGEGNVGGPAASICECRTGWGAACTVASDCKHLPGCRHLMDCVHPPLSLTGTCECKANCDATTPCPQGLDCAPIPWADKGMCVPEGGAAPP